MKYNGFRPIRANNTDLLSKKIFRKHFIRFTFCKNSKDLPSGMIFQEILDLSSDPLRLSSVMRAYDDQIIRVFKRMGNGRTQITGNR